MVHINGAERQISIKIVYFSVAGNGGKESLKAIKKLFPSSNTGEIVSIETGAGKTLFFDFLPVSLGRVGDYTIDLKLYAAPEAEYYQAARRIVLSGADGVVFIADPRKSREHKNRELIIKTLSAIGNSSEALSIALEWNGLVETGSEGIAERDEIEKALGQRDYIFRQITGEKDVLEVLKEMVKRIVDTI